jgi:hypothetical protein
VLEEEVLEVIIMIDSRQVVEEEVEHYVMEHLL